MCLGIRKDTVLRAVQLTDPNRGQEFEQILPVLYFKRPLTAPQHKKTRIITQFFCNLDSSVCQTVEALLNLKIGKCEKTEAST